MILVRLLLAALFIAAACLAGLYAAALWSPPGSGASVFFPASVQEEYCAGGGCPGRLVTAAAERAPLGNPALSARLSDALASGAGESAALARLVLSQDPRSEIARVRLAEDVLAAGDIDAFLRLYLPVFATDPRQAGVYAGVLADLSGAPEVYEKVSSYLIRERPSWAGAYLSALIAREQIPPSRMTGLFAAFPKSQAGLLNAVTRTGNWAGAYLVFNEFRLSSAPQGASEALGLATPFNPNLLEIEAPAPFNWRLLSPGAEFLPSGGVYAFFQGRRAENFLSQAFPLRPGDWRLAARLSGGVSETGGYFRLQLTCAASGARLAAFDIKELSAAPLVREFTFTHAPGCDFVILTLSGIAGSFPQPARIELTSLRLTPVNERAVP